MDGIRRVNSGATQDAYIPLLDGHIRPADTQSRLQEAPHPPKVTMKTEP